MANYYITNRILIDEKLATLNLISKSDEEWSACYVDPNTGENWELKQYHSEFQGGGFPVLKRLPLLSVNELIEVCLTSHNINDISGAAIDLYCRENENGEEFRAELIEKIRLIDASRLDRFEVERIKIIIRETSLSDSTNKKSILGKHWTEVKQDADFYRSIADKACKVLEALK